MRMHRVGTVTLGCVLIIFGILFILQMLLPGLSYELIFRLWPTMLIMLGAEVLLANKRSDKVEFVYDKGAVVLLIMLSLFAVFMAALDYGIQQNHIYYNYSNGFVF